MQPIPHSLRRLAVAGAAVLVLGGAAVGIAAAQAQPTPTTGQTGYQKFIDALAKRLNISPQNLETAVTQARSDAGLPAAANGSGFPGGRGRGGPGGFAGRGGIAAGFNVVATTLGITPQQLRTELQASRWRRLRRRTAKPPLTSPRH